MSGLDEAVIKNVEACKQLSKITRTSLGPNGKAHAPPSADLAPKNEQTRASLGQRFVPTCVARKTRENATDR
jgi:hypothetical protein